MPPLTLHQGESRAEYTEHPMEVAKRALREGARLEIESGSDLGLQLGAVMLRFASTLPEREPIRAKGGE
jgi:hypothetical protein